MLETSSPSKLTLYIGLLRPATLLSGASSVLVAIFYALYGGIDVSWLKITLLISIALLAQIASNIVNDLIDYKKGGDTKERKGPLRPLSKGLLTPKEVQISLGISIGVLCLISTWLISLSTPWLWLIGLAVILGLYTYSGGPFPLSRHGLGEIAVLIFFGWVPTITSFFILGGSPLDSTIWLLGTSIGFASVNILLVNNYRDYEEDKATNKKTLCVYLGKDFAPKLYLSLGLLSIGLLAPLFSPLGSFAIMPYLISFSRSYRSLQVYTGTALNMTLKHTAQNVLLLALTIGLILLFKGKTF